MARTAAGTLRLPRTITIEAAARTDVGLVREGNEDAWLADDELGLYAVADGMGGHQAGEVAARLALEITLEDFAEARARASSRDDADDTARALVLAIQRANRRILEAGRADARLRGMGTTFAGVARAGDALVIANVGDTRVLRLRNGALERLTRDHTMSEELRRAGVTTIQATTRNMLLRSLGTRQFLAVDARVERAMPGDVLLVCSDGVWDLVDEARIAGVLGGRASSASMVDELVDLALEGGGHDNATALVLRF